MRTQRSTPSPARQKGVALALGMIFLSILSIVVVVGTRTTTTQERIASNQNNKSISLLAAESGATQILQILTNDTETETGVLLANFPTDSASPQRLPNSSGAWFISSRQTVVPDPSQPNRRNINITVTGLSLDPVSNAQLSESVILLTSIENVVTTTPPGGPTAPRDFEAGGRVDVNGGVTFEGVGHVEGGWDVSSSGNNVVVRGSVSAGSGTTNRFANTTVGSGSPPNIPLVRDLPVWTDPSITWTNCTGTFVSGIIYYCNNSVAVNSNVPTNVTIYSRGSVSLTSASGRANPNPFAGLNVFAFNDVEFARNQGVGSASSEANIQAGGNMTIIGCGNCQYHGNFLANGSFINNGTGSTALYGSLRVNGNMRFNGGLRFFGPNRDGSGSGPGTGTGTPVTTYTRLPGTWREISS